MIKKIFLLLLFPFLGASLLTFAENRIPQNGWTKDAYHFKLDRPNTKIGLMVKCTPERGHNALFFIPLEVFIML